MSESKNYNFGFALETVDTIMDSCNEVKGLALKRDVTKSEALRICKLLDMSLNDDVDDIAEDMNAWLKGEIDFDMFFCKYDSWWYEDHVNPILMIPALSYLKSIQAI